MSTIAELLVKIGADSSGLNKELSKTQSSIQSAFSANPINEFTGALTGATNGISGMIGKISGFAALAAGGFGLGALVQSAVDAGESVYQMSTRMGISAGEAAELSRVLKLTGGDTQSFSMAMLRLDKSYEAAGEAGDKCRAVLEATGVSLTDSHGKLLPLNQQLEQLSKGYNIAAASGQQEEFIMNTLGARGMALVGTLKDYAAAKEAASRVQGVGLDPAQMHELSISMKTLSLESSQVGLAFTSALAPVAQEIFPPIMSGLKTTAAFLAENKAGVVELTKDAFELIVAYKSIQMLASAGNAIQQFWQTAAAEAAASTAAQSATSLELSATQERSIARAVAASDKMYAKMQTDAVKTAQAAGLSAEETASVIAEKSIEISTAAAEAATAIRTKMIEAFMTANAAAVESAGVINESLASTAIAAEEASAVKTATTTESAALCTAAVAESSAAQIEAIALVGEASTVAGGKSVAANEMSAVSAGTAAVAQKELAMATALPGNAAVLAGEKTVGAMATAEVAVSNLTSTVWALAGGWYGVAAAIGYAIYKLYDYYDSKGKVDSLGMKAEIYDDPYRPGMHQKKAWVETGEYDALGNKDTGHYERVNMSDAEEEELAGRQYKKDHAMDKPDIPVVDLSGIGGMGGHKKAGKSDAEKEWEKLEKQAEQVNKSIDSAYQDVMDNKVEKVDDWYKKEKDKLDASASANSRYTEVLGELDTAYAEKHRKAYAEMLSNSTSIWIEAAKSQRSLNDLVSTAGMEGPVKDLLDMQNKYNDSLAETEEKYKQLSVKFMGMDTESQTQYLLANPDVTKNDDGSLDFSKRLATEKAAIAKNYELQVRNYHADEKNWEWSIDQAFKNRSMADLQATLNTEAAMKAQERAGETAAMNEYYDLWKKTHRTAMDEMAEAANSFDSGLVNIFENIGKSVNSAGDLVKSFGSLVLETIWKIKAEELAANISMNIFGESLGGGAITSSNSSFGGKANFSLGSTDWLAGTRASGGPVSDGSPYLVGEEGPEIFIPSTSGSILSNRMSISNGGTLIGSTARSSGDVKVIVNNNSNATVTATDGGMDSSGMRQIIIDIATDGVLDKASRSPVFARNLRNAIGAG